MLTFVETRLFTQLVGQYFTDDEYAALQHAIAKHPETGDVVRGSGGVRSSAGAVPVVESAVASASSTSCD